MITYHIRRLYSCFLTVITKKKNSVALGRKLYRQSDRRLSAKLVPTFADIGCRVVSPTDPHGRILGFLDRSRYRHTGDLVGRKGFFFRKVAYSSDDVASEMI
jgi:hypothetical protein